MPYIARVLGAEKIGVYNYTYSIAIYFALVVKLGVDHYGNRSIAKVGNDLKKRSSLFSEIFGVQLISGIFCILVYIIYVSVFVNEYKEVAMLQVFLIISYLLDINWFFYGVQQFNIVIVRNVLVKLLTLVFVFLLVKNENDLWIYTLIMNVSAILGFLITWMQTRKFVNYKFVTITSIIKHIKPSAILFIPIVSATIYTSFTSVLLGQISTIQNVAFYNSGSQILSMPKGIIAALGTVMLPRMSSMYENNEEKSMAKKYINVSMIFALFLAIAFSFGLIGISSDFIPLFYGNEFNPSINVLKILSLYLPFYAIGNVIRTQFLIPQSKDKPFVVSVLLGAITSIVINLMLIKPLGLIGATIATFMSESVLAIYQMYSSRKDINFKEFVYPFIFFSLSGVIMLLAISNLPISSYSIFLRLTIKVSTGAFVYIICTGTYSVFSRNSIILESREVVKKRFNNTKK